MVIMLFTQNPKSRRNAGHVWAIRNTLGGFGTALLLPPNQGGSEKLPLFRVCTFYTEGSPAKK